ncbi:hypothetical protein TNCV_1668641 [Trichonephila clavipes]|nr:hypothetical protein TNCV_1668641 [Trichonephila clavipes]
MACGSEDCGFQILNDDEILTSMHEETDRVDDEMDEDERNSKKKMQDVLNLPGNQWVDRKYEKKKYVSLTRFSQD